MAGPENKWLSFSDSPICHRCHPSSKRTSKSHTMSASYLHGDASPLKIRNETVPLRMEVRR
jgi:hypothetical protein